MKPMYTIIGLRSNYMITIAYIFTWKYTVTSYAFVLSYNLDDLTMLRENCRNIK